MKLTVLMDNNTYIDRYYLGEPAVSYLVEDGGRTILFDAGYSGAFIENAARMRLDLSRVTDVALSHGHIDHTGGLPAFFERFTQPVRLYAHPYAFLPKRFEGMDAGTPLPLGDLPAWVEPHLSGKPKRISEHVTILGEIPRVYAFEEGRAVGETVSDCGCCWESDRLRDDTSLALTVSGGVFVVTGCAHSGICSAVAAAKRETGETRVPGVLGGFHLFETGNELEQTLSELKSLGVERVYPAHCTSLAVKAAFLCTFDTREVGVGLTLNW